MPTLQCRHCAAPLPEAAASGPVTCPYCQTVNEPTTAVQAPRALSAEDQKAAFKEAIKEEIEERILHGRSGAPLPVPSPAPPRPRSLGDSLRGCLTGCGCLVVLLGGALIYGFIKDPGAVARGFRQFAGGGLRPSDLREITSHEPVPLKVAPPAQGFQAFDPGRDLAWLTALAQAWAPDARLLRLRVVRLRADGAADLAGDPLAEVDAIFDSPAALARSLAGRARSYRQVNTGLELRIARGQVQARLQWGGPRPAPRPELASPLPVARLFGRLKEARLLPAQPLYNGSLVCDPKAGWTWAFQGLGDPSPIPRVRAQDGAILR
jgi:phage FluMu protein Com